MWDGREIGSPCQGDFGAILPRPIWRSKLKAMAGSGSGGGTNFRRCGWLRSPLISSQASNRIKRRPLKPATTGDGGAVEPDLHDCGRADRVLSSARTWTHHALAGCLATEQQVGHSQRRESDDGSEDGWMPSSGVCWGVRRRISRSVVFVSFGCCLLERRGHGACPV